MKGKWNLVHTGNRTVGDQVQLELLFLFSPMYLCQVDAAIVYNLSSHSNVESIGRKSTCYMKFVKRLREKELYLVDSPAHFHSLSRAFISDVVE